MFAFQVFAQKKPEEQQIRMLTGEQAQKVAQMLKENYTVMHSAMAGKG